MYFCNKRPFLALVFILLTAPKAVSQDDFASLYTKAKEAYKARTLAEFQTLIQKAVKLNPGHQGALYYAGVACSLRDKPDEAVILLERSISIDSRYPLKTNPDLMVLEGRTDFQRLLQFQAESTKPVIASDTAFVIPDRQLHAEGIAWDSKTNTFYLGSIHKGKIVTISAHGDLQDFLKKPVKGITSVFGLKVDTNRRLLWACSSPVPETNSYQPSMHSAVFKFNIDNNSLLETYEPDSTITGSVFGDLAVGPQGTIFISDGKNNIIFRLNESTKRLENYFTSPDFGNIQGLAFSDDGALLFIADYMKGLFVLHTATKQLSRFIELPLTSLKGIDGLLYHKKGLIAIQNGVFPIRVVRYLLDEQGLAIKSAQTIESHHPAFNEPTLGTMVGENLYYIANSQWSGYDAQHQIKAADQLQDIVILKTKLTPSPR